MHITGATVGRNYVSSNDFLRFMEMIDNFSIQETTFYFLASSKVGR
jgi:hypothetical protein